VYGNEIKRGMFCAGFLEGIYDACRVGWRKNNSKSLTQNLFFFFGLAQEILYVFYSHMGHADIFKCGNVTTPKDFQVFYY